jgi:Ca2+-binding RTX toxin-like protein
MVDITGDDNPNFLEGTNGTDHLSGLGGDDVLYGKDGIDVLTGGAGADYLHGGASLDYANYSTSQNAVLIDLGTGDAAGGDAFGDTLVQIESVFGSGSGDLLFGNDVFNILYGGGGNDLIVGRGGADSLAGDGGDDTLDGGDGDDTLSSDPGSDHFDGGAGIDLANYGQSPTGVVVDLSRGEGAGGEAFGDTYVEVENVWGSGAQDLILANGVTNELSGFDGNDVMEGRGGHDRLDGGNGADSLSGDDGNDVLFGAAGNDRLTGGTGRDVQSGGTGDDFLSGENGPDPLTGNQGLDTLRGGVGADSFIYNGVLDSPTGVVPLQQDVILDFTQADADIVDLGAIDAASGTPGNQAFTFIGTAAFGGVAGQLRFQTQDGVTSVLGDVDGNAIADIRIRLIGAIVLTAGDFVL